VSEKIKLLVGAINRLRGQRFDLIVANLTAQIIEVQVGQMAELLADDGVLILSGLLAEQEAAMREKLAQARLGVVDCLASDEWLALVSHRQRIE
jgi:ribosomal protein L11 methyltransferase